MANKKIIRLTEKDLERMVRRIIKESDDYETNTPIKPITIHGKTYKFVEDLPIRELGIGSYVVDNDKGIVLVDGDTPLEDWLDHVMGGVEGEEETEDMDVPGEDYMSSEEDLINAAYELMYDLGDEDVEILDLQDAANILDEELYEGNHGPIMDKKIEDLLTQIYEIIGYPDYEEGEDIEDHLDYMAFKKPGFMQRIKQGVRDIVGKGNEEDENTLKMIYRVMDNHPDMVDTVRQDTRGNAITAWVNGKALIVDRSTPEIIYNGKTLEIADLEHKTFMLYNELISFLD